MSREAPLRSPHRRATLAAALGFLALEPRAGLPVSPWDTASVSFHLLDREVPVCDDARPLIFRTS